MEPQTITISCQGAVTVGLEELHDLQGDLKDLSDKNYTKLKNSILKYGFSFPVFIWIDPENQKWIVDSHQRVRVLSKMRDEGYTIPPLPADIIYAKDKVEAKEKILILNSRYGQMTREGYDAFIDEPGLEIDDQIEEMLSIPDIEYFPSDEKQEEPEEKRSVSHEVVCPNCSTSFIPQKSVVDKAE